ncbi:MAG: hypothetical protein JOS17DRAFT_587758 [Linnemannia elongata]|nr:MAG: hypothetical protein JOS17DRAFT_587758 [Linnemannia elongata]
MQTIHIELLALSLALLSFLRQQAAKQASFVFLYLVVFIQFDQPLFGFSIYLMPLLSSFFPYDVWCKCGPVHTDPKDKNNYEQPQTGT